MTTCGARVSPHSTSCKLSTVWGALTRSSRWEADLGRSLEIGRRGQRDATVNLSVFGVIRVAPQHSVLLAKSSTIPRREQSFGTPQPLKVAGIGFHDSAHDTVGSECTSSVELAAPRYGGSVGAASNREVCATGPCSPGQTTRNAGGPLGAGLRDAALGMSAFAGCDA
jgi:hypothetical protein